MTQQRLQIALQTCITGMVICCKVYTWHSSWTFSPRRHLKRSHTVNSREGIEKQLWQLCHVTGLESVPISHPRTKLECNQQGLVSFEYGLTLLSIHYDELDDIIFRWNWIFNRQLSLNWSITVVLIEWFTVLFCSIMMNMQIIKPNNRNFLVAVALRNWNCDLLTKLVEFGHTALCNVFLTCSGTVGFNLSLKPSYSHILLSKYLQIVTQYNKWCQWVVTFVLMLHWKYCHWIGWAHRKKQRVVTETKWHIRHKYELCCVVTAAVAFRQHHTLLLQLFAAVQLAVCQLMQWTTKKHTMHNITAGCMTICTGWLFVSGCSTNHVVKSSK